MLRPQPVPKRALAPREGLGSSALFGRARALGLVNSVLTHSGMLTRHVNLLAEKGEGATDASG